MKDKDNKWIIEHEQELEEKYAGKYVAVVDGRIAGLLAVAYLLRRRKRCKE